MGNWGLGNLVGLGVVGVVAAVACGMPACSSKFTDCASARDCAPVGEGGQPDGEAGSPANDGGASAAAGQGGASSGSAGAGQSADGGVGGESAGTAGVAGAIGVPTCSHDADCSDGLACNGLETCDNGTCKPGIAPCANPDPLNCDAVCTELTGAASCAVRGQDKDGDGHYSAKCATNAGDDCDDSRPTVHPGAPELCDQLDNDCNGKIDLADGLGAGGTVVDIAPSGHVVAMPRIAWAASSSSYLITYEDSTPGTSADLFSTIITASGTVKGAATALNDASSLTAATPGLSLVHGGDSFGALWTVGSKAYLRVAPDTGVFAPRVELVSQQPLRNPVLARTSDGTWYIAYVSGTYLILRTVSSQGAVGDEQFISASQMKVAGLGVGSGLALTFDGGNEGGPTHSSELMLLDQGSKTVALGTGNSTSFFPNGKGDGFAATSAKAGSALFQFTSFNTLGAVTCGPVDLPVGFVPSGAVATPTGYLLVSSGAINAQEVLANCTLGAHFPVFASASTDVSIAGGTSGYAVVWQDTATQALKRRVFGPHYCD